jgi:ATP-dependent DNA helicase RecG
MTETRLESPRDQVLLQTVDRLPGVGPQRAALLAKLFITTVGELLLHRPRRYEDRRRARSIRELQEGEPAITSGVVVSLGVKWFRKRSRSVFELVIEDGSGRLHCRWWNAPYMEKNFAKGDALVVFGKLKESKPRTMDHPEVEIVDGGEEKSIHLHRIVPVYPLTDGLAQRWLRGLVWRTLENLRGEADRLWPDTYDAITTGLPSRAKALYDLHFPEEQPAADLARKRLALDEFVDLQLGIRRRRRNLETKASALPCGGDNRWMRPFLARLGFKLTSAQTRVLREIRADLSARVPMRRLLQGDVGCGKTLVAACTALMTLESGHDAVLMAPTEILAEQHYRTFTKWFSPMGIPTELMTGSTKTWKKELDGTSHPRLFIGTHAMLEKEFAPARLGLVVIDEQHKFGVSQRTLLLRKGNYPHLLVMTATPIPRTLGLTLYGDLDFSIIDEVPPGRGRIKTVVRGSADLPKVWSFLKQTLAAGRQGYVVYPRIDDPEGETKALLGQFASVQSVLAPFPVGLVHGRMKGAEKESIMESFRKGELKVLLATSLIEVGVDVPNATFMVVESADSFGLSQLHQLRGRIGRGAHESYCVLVSAKRSQPGPRLNVMIETTDGFAIAEADLRLRGPGDLLGTEQSGVPQFRFGDLTQDFALIETARRIAAMQPT